MELRVWSLTLHIPHPTQVVGTYDGREVAIYVDGQERARAPACDRPEDHGGGTLNPQPSTLNPQPSTLNHGGSTLNPQPSTLNPKPLHPCTLNPEL